MEYGKWISYRFAILNKFVWILRNNKKCWDNIGILGFSLFSFALDNYKEVNKQE